MGNRSGWNVWFRDRLKGLVAECMWSWGSAERESERNTICLPALGKPSSWGSGLAPSSVSLRLSGSLPVALRPTHRRHTHLPLRAQRCHTGSELHQRKKKEKKKKIHSQISGMNSMCLSTHANKCMSFQARCWYWGLLELRGRMDVISN